MLIGDLAHNLFQDVFERDQPLQNPVLIHHQRKMRAAAQELAHLFIESCRFWYKIRFHSHFSDIKSVKRRLNGSCSHHVLMHGAQEVFGVDHTNDIVLLAAINGQACVVAAQTTIQNFLRLKVSIDHLDPGTVKHDLLHGPLCQIKRTQNTVAIFLLNDPFGMPQRKRSCNFFPHSKNMAIRVGLDPEETQQKPYEPTHGTYNRREYQNNDPNRRRHKTRSALCIGDRVGLGQHFGKHQNKHRHDQSRHCHATFAKNGGKKRGRQRGCENIHKVVAQKNRADQPLVVLGDLKCALGA